MIRRRRILVLAAVVLALAIGGAWYALRNGTPSPGRKHPASAPARNEKVRAVGGVLSAAGEWPMYRGGRSLAGVAKGQVGENPVLVWRFKTGGAIKSSPAVADGRVFFGSDDEKVYCVDLAGGSELWTFNVSGAVEASPLVLAGVVYVGSQDGFLYALDARDGKLNWKYRTGGDILGSANWYRDGRSGLTRILVGSYDNMLHCIDAAGGKRVWAYETKSYVNGAPAVAGSKIAFGGCDESIHVISTAGRRMVSAPVGSPVAGSVAMVGRRVFVGGHGGDLLCIDAETGEELWRYDTGGRGVLSTPAVASGRVVFGCRDRQVYCVDCTNGRELWTFRTRGAVDGSPVICGSKVLVGGGDGRLYILRLSDGRRLWSREIGGAIVSSPAVVGSALLISSRDGYVYALRTGV